MHRIVVVGNSGSGKTTLSRKLAEKLQFPYLELDSLYHQSRWRPLPEDEFQARVAEFALQPSWIIDGNYTSAGMPELVWPVADTMVWLDLPRWLVVPRLIGRSVKRVLTREELWNGNRERLRGLFDPRPDRNVVLWSITRHGDYQNRFQQARADVATAHLRLYRLCSRGDITAFIDGVQ